MFAFAVWDAHRARLWLARDRLGIKPLYWTRAGGNLVFASELKGILASGLVPRTLDEVALNMCLAFAHVPPPLTLIEGARALPPGHTLTVEGDGPVRIERYWQLPDERDDEAQLLRDFTIEDAQRRVRELLEESVRLHMISDVPLGAFLSGGLDSTIVAGLMSRQVDRPIQTFCIHYGREGRRLSERPYAAAAAEHFGCDHVEILVNGTDVAREFDRFIWHLDQPSVDGLNSYLVSHAARQKVTVALSGLGGDELFMGYPHVLRILRADRLRANHPVIDRLPRNLSVGPLRRLWPGLADLEWAARPVASQYEDVCKLMPDNDRGALLAGRSATAHSHVHPVALPHLGRALLDAPAGDLANRLSRIELEHYMSPVLLRDMDAVSMAHALEVRPPFLDHKLVEFVSRLPARLKLGGGPPKPLLAGAVRDLVPPMILNRPKAFFHLPMSAWLQHELRDRIEDATSDDAVRKRGLLNPAAVAAVRRRFATRPNDWTKLWMLAVLEWWMRRYLDAPVEPDNPAGGA
jgi:asparagine synthase (glutamine-hydrolysing)